MPQESLKSLTSRVAAAEKRLDRMEESIDEMQDDFSGTNRSLINLEGSIAKFSDSVKKIGEFENEMRLLREKLLTYDAKFATITEIRNMLGALLLALIPIAVSVLSNVLHIGFK